MKALLIIGCGGHGKVVAETAELCGYERIAFLDDLWPQINFSGIWPVISSIDAIDGLRREFDHCFVAIGDNTVRLDYLRRAEMLDYERPSLVHPKAIFSKYAEMGKGSIVCMGAVAGVFVKVGSGVILNTGCTVDHDCVLEDGVHISPGAHIAGGVQIGKRTWVGVGASIIERISVGKDVTVGAGASVICDIPDRNLYVGVPAQPVKKR